MSLTLALANSLIGLLPATRAYRWKAWMLRRAGLDVAPSARIVSSVRIHGTAEVTIGPDTFVGHDVLITGGDCRIEIGAQVDIAPRVTIVAGTHEIDMVGAHSAGRGFSRDIRIGEGAWIGAGSTILGGVTIGQKAVIAAGSTVIGDIPPYTLAAGVPCRPKKTWQPAVHQWKAAAA